MGPYGKVRHCITRGRKCKSKSRESIQLTNHGVLNSSLRRPECGVMDAIGQMHDDREWVRILAAQAIGFYHVKTDNR
jgi:hypothetical protein